MNIRTIAAVCVMIAAVTVWLLQRQTYEYPEQSDIASRVRYLQRVMESPRDPASDLSALGSVNAEWYLFSSSFTAYAMTNLAVRDTTYRPQAKRIIRAAITNVLRDDVSFRFGLRSLLRSPDSIPQGSVLYLGHLNLMLGCYRLVGGDRSFDRLNDAITRSLISRYHASPNMLLESYPSRVWIPDNTVAVASLNMHAVVTKNGKDPVCAEWIRFARTHFLEEHTGVLCTATDPHTGAVTEGPRGSMAGWSIMFLLQIDPVFAKEQYERYRNAFSGDLGVWRLFRERSGQWETSAGDVDSGPLVLGFGAPATVFAFGDAVMCGDGRTAKQLERFIGLGTTTEDRNGERSVRAIASPLNINPMIDAILLFSMTGTRWTE